MKASRIFHVHRKKVLSSLMACVALAGCGGGGNSSPASTGPTAEGVYGGTLTGGSYPAFQAIVLENGDFYSMYGTQNASFFGIAGFTQGSGASSNGSYTSTNAKDFGFSPAASISLNATYNATARTISGTTSANGTSTSFSGGPITGSTYNYNTAPSLTTISGSWTLSTLTTETIALTVSGTGVLSGITSLNCALSGSILPRASGKNVFNVSITFGAAPCALPGQTASGIGLAYPLSNGTTQLLVVATDTTRMYGAVGFGTR